MPETAWNYWNLIQFREHVQPDGTLQWLMRKDQCMHCADPGCLAACPADNAIVQYQNGIVDFQQDYCIGCQYCVTGCPFTTGSFAAKRHAGGWAPVIARKMIIADHQLAYAA
jgi:formate dehydrogenase iron-sulfur subunit